MTSLYTRTNLSIGVLVLTLCLFMPIEVGALHDGRTYHLTSVEVCNEGNTEISVAVALEEGAFFGDSKWKYEGWYTVRPGKCKQVSYKSSGYTPYLAFRQRDARGRLGIAPYRDGDGLSGYSSIRDASKILCVHPSEAFELEFTGKVGSCYPPYVMAEFSAYIDLSPIESNDIRVDVASSAAAQVMPFDSGPAAEDAPKKKAKPNPNILAEAFKLYEEERREERRAAREKRTHIK